MFEQIKLTASDNLVINFMKQGIGSGYNSLGLSIIQLTGNFDSCVNSINNGSVVIVYNPAAEEVYVKPHPTISGEELPSDHLETLRTVYFKVKRELELGTKVIDHISLVTLADTLVGNPVYVEDWIVSELLRNGVLRVSFITNDGITLPVYTVVQNEAKAGSN